MPEVADSVLSASSVDIRLPSDPAMAKVARLAAGGLASMHDFSVAEIEDVKLAVSELIIVLVEHGLGRPVEVRFWVTADEFVVESATAIDDAFDIDHPDLRLSRVVLEGVCTEHRFEVGEGEARIVARLRRPFPGQS